MVQYYIWFSDQKFYVELTMKADTERGVPGPHPKKRPLVRCDSESIAQKVNKTTSQHMSIKNQIFRYSMSGCPQAMQ